MPRRKAPKPGPGQGSLLEGLPESQVVKVEDFEFNRSNIDAPATSLVDRYAALSKAVKAIGRARSNSIGFAKLSEDSAPVKEYGNRLDADNDEAKRIVVAAASRHKLRAWEAMRKLALKEQVALNGYARATNAYEPEFVLPPDVTQLEHDYFTDPGVEPKDLEAKRTQLYRRAEYYAAVEEAAAQANLVAPQHHDVA